MNIELILMKEEDKSLLVRLMELYNYEFTRYDDEDINETAKKLDLDVTGVDPNKEGVPVPSAGADSYDEGASTDDEQVEVEESPEGIIADIGNMADEDMMDGED